MKISTMLRLGAVLLCCILSSQAQNTPSACKCDTFFDGKCNAAGGASPCECKMNIGPDSKNIDCSKLIPKCWLMKKESLGSKDGRRLKPEGALIDNDGLYNPECDVDGIFKAKQCNAELSSCWCVNSAGVRRTDKGDGQKKCAELVRTYWVIIQIRPNTTEGVSEADVKTALRTMITTRYKLADKYIDNIEFDTPYYYIDLKQNSSQKVKGEIDIADVGYYLEKDIKGDNLMNADNKFAIPINGQNFGVTEPLIMYVDEKPHELSMKRLTAGVIAVIVVVVVAIVAGIVVLVITRRKRGKYEKAEMNEMNAVQKEQHS